MAGAADEITGFASADEFLRSPASGARGCVVAPSDLPDAGTRTLVEALRARGAPLAVVVLGCDSELATAVELVRAGAVEYLAPPLSLGRLLSAVRWAVHAHPS